MLPEDPWVRGLNLQLEGSDPQQLAASVQKLAQEYSRAMKENLELRRQLDERNNESDSGDSLSWIRADLDWPEVQTSGCHTSPQVVVFNAGTKELDVERVEKLRGEQSILSLCIHSNQADLPRSPCSLFQIAFQKVQNRVCMDWKRDDSLSFSVSSV